MLVDSISGVDKGSPGRDKALPNICCVLPLRLKNRDTLMEQLNILINQSVDQVVPLPTH